MKGKGSSDVRAGNKPQAAFVPQVVHELKTVLANVCHSSELLTEELLGPLSPQQREVAGILRENSHKLQLLIEYLAAYDTWRDQAGHAEPTRFPLRPLLERCVHRFKPIAAPREINIDLNCAEIEACADSVGLCLILDSLMSHAVQFSPLGGAVTISAAVESSPGRAVQGEELLIEVADQGPGIAPGQRESIFANSRREILVWQGDRPSMRGGLAVARDCVAAQGGSIEIVSGQPIGAHFRVRLPMEPNHAI